MNAGRQLQRYTPSDFENVFNFSCSLFPLDSPRLLYLFARLKRVHTFNSFFTRLACSYFLGGSSKGGIVLGMGSEVGSVSFQVRLFALLDA